nr:hypothetical protein [Tanacetum cinerariifolium]
MTLLVVSSNVLAVSSNVVVVSSNVLAVVSTRTVPSTSYWYRFLALRSNTSGALWSTSWLLAESESKLFQDAALGTHEQHGLMTSIRDLCKAVKEQGALLSFFSYFHVQGKPEQFSSNRRNQHTLCNIGYVARQPISPSRLSRVARVLQDTFKADELAKDQIQAEEVPRFEDHVPPHTIRAKVGNVEVLHFGLAFVVKN